MWTVVDQIQNFIVGYQRHQRQLTNIVQIAKNGYQEEHKLMMSAVDQYVQHRD